MKRISLLTSILIAISFLPSIRAEEVIKDKSPDGTVALRIQYSENDSGNVETGLIELSTHKVLLDLNGPGRPYVNDAKLVWSGNSQRVAFFEPSRRGGLTRVFFRNGGSFQEVELPTLPAPKTTKKVPTGAYDKTIEGLEEPVRWLKSGALIIYSEVEGDYSGRGALEITVGFDNNHKPSVLKSKTVTPRPIEENGD
jgi:hypothetical protein